MKTVQLYIQIPCPNGSNNLKAPKLEKYFRCKQKFRCTLDDDESIWRLALHSIH